MRLADRPSDSERAAFEAWRAQSLDHEIAFEREAAAWEELDRLKVLRAPQIVADPELLAPTPIPGARPSRRRLGRQGWAAMAASLLVAVTGGAAAVVSVSASPAYATGIGERRLVRLPDGSTVELNTDSKIVLRRARGGRIIDLIRGEAMLHVAKDARPVDIRARTARLHAQSGEVVVRLRQSNTQIIVKEGVVVAETEAAPNTRIPLPSRSGVLIDTKISAIHHLSPEDLEKALAWRQGAIILDGETLSEAVAEFNRYNVRKIVVTDRSAGALRVGGYFDASDIDGFVTALTRAFPVRADHRGDGAVILSRSA